MAVHAIIPSRFLSLVAHLVVTIMLFWSRESNVLSCIPTTGTVGSSDYTTKDTQLLVGFSLSLVFLCVELAGLVTGLSMFYDFVNLFSIGLHCAAAITLALFAAQSWSCDTFWYVFGFCSIVPLIMEICLIAYTLKFKVFN